MSQVNIIKILNPAFKNKKDDIYKQLKGHDNR